MPKRGTAGKAWTNAGLLAISLAISLLAAEVVVAHVAPQELTGTFRIRDAQGLTLHQPNRRIRLPSGVTYRFDARGLRIPPTGMRSTAASGSVRLLVLGDSYTFGWRLDEPDTYVARLRSSIEHAFPDKGIELLNGAHSGWGAADYVDFVERYAESLDIDGVLVYLNAFDVDRSFDGNRYQWTPEAGLRRRPPPPRSQGFREVARSIPGYNFLLEHSHLAQATRRLLLQRPERAAPMIDPHPRGTEAHVQLAEALFQRLQELCRERRLPLLVLSTGFLDADLSRMEPTTAAARTFYADAPRFFAELGIPYHDIGPELKASVGGNLDALLFPDDPHPNALGAARIADASWPWVRDWIAAMVAGGSNLAGP
ncbi:MAG: hypothetical protein R3E10_11625 [Gemmatimonadota bacterium]